MADLIKLKTNILVRECLTELINSLFGLMRIAYEDKLMQKV